MFKKVALADAIAGQATAVFDAASAGQPIAASDAWLGALSYTLQLYFDFSGYSDMAIGLALMFGIVLPMNFFSPYKATSLIEFWRRWHMTLSRFLRDYLYIPLGGSRRGMMRRHMNLFATMVLGGLWHGASWTFVLWGALHGLGLIANNGWRSLAGRLGLSMPVPLGWALTMLLVVLAWVPFRADGLEASMRIWAAMVGSDAEPVLGHALSAWSWVAALSLIAVFMPNTAEIFDISKPGRWYGWAPRPVTAILLGCLLGWAVAGSLTRPSAFLYFQF